MSEDLRIFEDERRCGGPVLSLLPSQYLELDREDPLRDENKREALQSEIIRCLEDAGVHARSIWLTRQHYGYDDDTKSHRVYVITAKLPKPGPHNPWIAASSAILELFRAQGHPGLNVDIRPDYSCPRGYHVHPESFPLLPSDSSAINWVDLRPKLLTVLEDSPWLSIDFARYGESKSARDNPVTLFVTLQKDTPAKVYRHVKQTLVTFLERSRPVKIEVVVLLGRVELHLDAYDQEHYSLKAGVGANIGLKGDDKKSGTLGGYITLQHPSTGECRVFGLTCWHVVRPAAHPEITRLDSQGMKPDETCKMIEVIRPSLAHHQDNMNRYKEIFQMLQQRQNAEDTTPDGCTRAYKKGSMTEFTDGPVQGQIPSVVREVEGLERQSPPSDEWQVLAGRSGRSLYFSLKGDSGAFCFDERGNWVGLVWGGNPRLRQTYVTDAVDVIHDMEHVTGWKFVDFKDPFDVDDDDDD
ncbi:MAG: hypothetical protein M1816_000266 [Peltula sp. TS41687]|nr:MAG: hypothetical protein M1816_000266 [Peltula sp. TS41687]